jgi:SAM-dependent methyltransferase
VGVPDHYGSHYRAFDADVHTAVRRAAFDEDVGQNSWVTRAQLDEFGRLLGLGPPSRLLDVASGSGGPALHLARTTGCAVVGVDVDAGGVEHGRQMAAEAGLEQRVEFQQTDASEPLPFADGTFDALLCVDAINHIDERGRVFADWARLLRPDRRLVLTDPLVATGLLRADELAVRASIGSMVLAPPGEDERLLEAAGLEVLDVRDLTAEAAEVAQRRHDVRAELAGALREAEGAEAFAARQRFFAMAALLAREGRLSRFAYVARRS